MWGELNPLPDELPTADGAHESGENPPAVPGALAEKPADFNEGEEEEPAADDAVVPADNAVAGDGAEDVE